MRKVLNLISGKPKLSSIISSITTQVTQLNKLVEANNAEVDANNSMITSLQVDNSNLGAESATAGRIASRLSNLVS